MPSMVVVGVMVVVAVVVVVVVVVVVAVVVVVVDKGIITIYRDAVNGGSVSISRRLGFIRGFWFSPTFWNWGLN